jgi:hypothetical protein
MDAEVESPSIPQNLAAVDAEARTVGLCGDERLQRPRRRRRARLRCAASGRRQRGFENIFNRTAGEIDADSELFEHNVFADRIPHERRRGDRNRRSAMRQARAFAQAAEERHAIGGLYAMSRQCGQYAFVPERDLGGAIDHDATDRRIAHRDRRRCANRPCL